MENPKQNPSRLRGVDTLIVNGDVNDDYQIIINEREFKLYLDSGFWQISENGRLITFVRKQSHVGAVCAALEYLERYMEINETGRRRKPLK